MPLDSTIGATTSNSYIDIATATALLTLGRLRASAWVDATGEDTDREAALRWATSLLDVYFEFDGAIVSNDQALRWPRYNSHDADGRLIEQTVIPLALQRGTAELALELLKRDRSAEPGLLGLGFREAKVGSLAVKLDMQQIPQLIPDSIYALMWSIAIPSPGAQVSAGSRQLDVRRS